MISWSSPSQLPRLVCGVMQSWYYVTVHVQSEPHSPGSLQLPTAPPRLHTRTCFTFLRRFHRDYRENYRLIVKKIAKQVSLFAMMYRVFVQNDVGWKPCSTHSGQLDMWSAAEPMLCHSPPQRRWMCLSWWGAPDVSGARSGWSVVTMRSEEWWNRDNMDWPAPATASSVSPGILTPCAVHPVSTRCITTL